MFIHRLNSHTELRLIQHLHCPEVYKVMEGNRRHLLPWHPWIDQVHSMGDVDRLITKWLQQFASNRGFHCGIWHEGKLCGAINHLNVDWANRTTVLSYWLDESHQGRGLMTAACHDFVTHAFTVFNLNRITIECASENIRSRKIPERLGFKLEGIIRGAEWLHNHYADHAVYGLLKSDRLEDPARAATVLPVAAPGVRPCDRTPAEILN